MTTPKELAKLQGLIAPARLTEGITNRQMSILLKDATAAADVFITDSMMATSFSKKVKQQQLTYLRTGLGEISTELWTQTGKLTTVGMYAQAALAADQALDRDFFMGMPGSALLQMSHGNLMNANAGIHAVLSRRTEGFVLSERIYAQGKISTAAVGKIIERNLLLQSSAATMAKEVRGHFDPAVPGGASYASMRLARTEINNAHHSTTIRMSEARPWVLAYEWNLSGSHPRPDECNDYEDNDSYGLGAGKYPKGSAPARPHPNCLCYLTHVHEDEEVFMKKLMDGSYEDQLGKQGVSCQ